MKFKVGDWVMVHNQPGYWANNWIGQIAEINKDTESYGIDFQECAKKKQIFSVAYQRSTNKSYKDKELKCANKIRNIDKIKDFLNES